MSEKHASTTKAASQLDDDARARAREERAEAKRIAEAEAAVAAQEQAEREARTRAREEAARNAPEHVDGFHVVMVDGVIPRYVSDHDGYQTAFAHEAKAHLREIGRG